jgi:hypothetical protein
MALKLKVYRKVEDIDDRTQAYFQGTGHLAQGKFVWSDGAWDDWATQELILKTTGWAVGTEDGEIVAEYKTGNEAYDAALGAKVDIKKSISLPDLKKEVEIPVDEEALKPKKA